MVTAVYNLGEIQNQFSRCGSRIEILGDPQFRNILYDHLNSQISANKILSLDVFDTFILRDNSSELSRFIEIGDQMALSVYGALGSKVSAKVKGIDAFLARYFGTKSTYRISCKVDGCREGSLNEIHATACRMLGLPDIADLFVDAELDYEATRIVPNDAILEFVRQHRAKGGRVVLVSDMYMHGHQIQSLLSRLGIEDDLYDQIFSSADTKVSKASGGIFKLVEKALSASPGDFFHIGDSLKGDYQRPIARGWGAMHMPVAESEIEKRRADHFASAARLKETFGLTLDIAVPH